MIKQPKISILTSCYNHADFVEELVRSVYGQQGVDFEFLVIDDGSSDESVNRLSRLSIEYGFAFESQANKGFTPTLNKLLSQAKGEYIVVIASDDVLAPDRLKLQVDFLDNYPRHAAVCGDVVELDENGEMGKKISYPFYEEGLFEKLLLKDLFILAPSVMVRRNIIEELGGWDEDLAIEDWDMWLRIAEKHPIAYLDQVFAFYRIHSGNSHGNYEKMYAEMERTLEKFQHVPYYEKARAKMYQDAALYLSGLKNYKNLAFNYWLKTIKRPKIHTLIKTIAKMLFVWKE